MEGRIHFNGTNVLERGVGFADLSDEATGKYFTVTKEGNFIPLQLTGKEKVVTGFSNDGAGTYFGRYIIDHYKWYSS